MSKKAVIAAFEVAAKKIKESPAYADGTQMIAVTHEVIWALTNNARARFERILNNLGRIYPDRWDIILDLVFAELQITNMNELDAMINNIDIGE